MIQLCHLTLLLFNYTVKSSTRVFAVARTRRDEESLRGVRLVAVSGNSSVEDHAKAKAAGFASLMIKPLTEESLRTLVQ
jgi:CheY-like chemotaxis protein